MVLAPNVITLGAMEIVPVGAGGGGGGGGGVTGVVGVVGGVTGGTYAIPLSGTVARQVEVRLPLATKISSSCNPGRLKPRVRLKVGTSAALDDSEVGLTNVTGNPDLTD